jgi:hypothetical protein
VRALIVLIALARTARAQPSDERLFWVGLAMAPPTYLVGVSLHEGSHALMAELVGGDAEEVHLFPPARDPRVGKFRFGWVYATGLRSKPQKILFYLAPKITDSLLLGGFTALVLADAWPENKYGQLALVVGATGLWVDFAKDLVLFSRHNDVVKAFNQWCMKGWKQLPARLLYAGAVAGFGYAVVRGYQMTFGDDPSTTTMPRMLPIVSATF